MIYLRNITDAQSLMIPKNGEMAHGQLSLVLRNTTNLEGPTFSVLDLDTSALYFNVAVTLPADIAEGEYQYQLMDGDVLVSCGLLYIGDLQDPSQYQNTITYKQYESE